MTSNIKYDRMNREGKGSIEDAEKAFFGPGGLEGPKPPERPAPQEVHKPSKSAEEATAKRAATKDRQKNEAELRVQAWFDAGMRPAERERGLEMVIEDLEETFENIGSKDDPSKDKTVESINRRSEELLEKLNNAKAELTVLRRRLKEMKEIEAFPTLPETDLEPIEDEPTDPDNALGATSGETTMFFPARKDTTPIPRAAIPKRRSPALDPAPKLQVVPDVRTTGTPIIRPSETRKTDNASSATSLADRARSAWNTVTSWFGGKKEAAPEPSKEPFNEAAYRSKEATYKANVRARDARETGRVAKENKETESRAFAANPFKAEATRTAATERTAHVSRAKETRATEAVAMKERALRERLINQELLHDERAQVIKKILADKRMNEPKNKTLRARYEKELQTRRDLVATQVRRDDEEGAIANK